MAVTVLYGSKRLVVEAVGDDDPNAICYLGRGGTGDSSVWIRLTWSDTALPRRAVAISCPMEGAWQIRRESEKVGVEVRFQDGSRLVIPSDRWRLMPAEMEHAFVVVQAQSRLYEFSVQLGRHGEPYRAPDGADDTVTLSVIRADPDIGYFRVCVALCEPRLLDPFSESLPTEPEICERLINSGIEPGVNVKKVQRRLEAVRSKLGVTTNRELRDRLLASRAVTENHLRMLSQTGG